MRLFALLLTRGRSMRPILAAVVISSVMLIWCLAASAQAPYILGQRQGLIGPDIDFQTQALTFSVPVVGTPFRFCYRSDALAPKWRLDVNYVYDPAAKVLSPGDGRPRSATPSFDSGEKAPSWLSAGEVAIVEDEDQNVLYVFDKQGLHLRTLSALTGTVVYRFSYGASGALTAVEDSYGNSTKIERDGKGFITAIVAPFGQRTVFANDASGHPTRITNPAGEPNSFGYSADGQLATLIDARGKVYHFTLASDTSGEAVEIQDPLGGAVNQTLSSKGAALEVSRESATGRSTAMVVEHSSAGGLAMAISDASGSRTQLESRTDGTTKFTYPDGMVVIQQLQPDTLWGSRSLLLKSFSIATPAGITSTLALHREASLADSGNPLSLTTLVDTLSLNGKAYTRTFDAAGKQVTWVSAAGRKAVATLDNHGRVVKLEMLGLFPMEFAYDERGRLISLTQGSGSQNRVTALKYNAQGLLDSITDPRKQTVRLQYDSASRITKRIIPNGGETDFGYDANGNVTAITPPGRPSHSFEFTPVNLISAYSPPSADQGHGSFGILAAIRAFISKLWNWVSLHLHLGHGATGSEAKQSPGATRYANNKDGQLIKIVQPDRETVELSYDDGGRLSAVTGTQEKVSYGYDPKTAHLTTLASSNGELLSQTLDGPLLTELSWTGAVKGAARLTYDNDLRTASTAVNNEPPVALRYDPDGLLTQAGSLGLTIDHTSGFVTGTALGSVTTAYEFNGFGELTAAHTAFKGKDLFSDQYERDALGRIVAKTEVINEQSSVYKYAYDPAGRLTSVTTNGKLTARYEYDANGNRLTYTAPNGTVKGSYDAQDQLKQYGNATYVSTAHGERRSKTVQGKTTAYSYDSFGNLKSVSLPDGTKIDYVIDGGSQRIGKMVNGKLVQGFLYQDQLRPIAELDGSNNVVSRFVYGTKINVPEYMQKAGKTYRIISDQLGSPRLVVDVATGEIAQRLDYDEFGNVVADTNPGFQPFGFAGGLYDPQTKLTRFGARDYDADTGRWTWMDPMLFGAGDTDLFAYVRNDPVNAIDPTGLAPVTTVGISGTGWLMGHAVTGQGGFAVGSHGDIAVFVDVGGGLEASATNPQAGYSAGTSVMVYPNATQTTNLRGAFVNASWSGGAVLGGSGDFAFDPSHPSNFGVGGTGGTGGGFGQFTGETNTWVWPLPPWARVPTGLGDWLGGTGAGDWWRCHMTKHPSGCSGSGSGWGDLHMTTFDGDRYDLQAAGEFVAMQDRAGQDRLQIRLEPDGSHSVTYCTAVAAQVDGAKVAIHLKPQAQVYVNGQAVELGTGKELKLGNAGGIIHPTDRSWNLTWPDATSAQISSNGEHCDLNVQPGKLAGILVGLMGNADGKPEGDLVTRNGLVLAPNFTSKDLYGRFAESWRISQAESLFHYAKGESTATFTDRSVPHQDVSLATLDPAARSKAAMECRNAGITAPGPLADCILDFAMTGDRSFIASASQTQTTFVAKNTTSTPSTATGIRLDAPPDLVSTLNHWRVVHFGEPSQVVQELDRDHRAAILPPGEYQITSVGQGTINWVTWPQKVQVQAGQQASFAMNSSVRLDVPQDLVNTLNHWQVVRFGNPSQVVQELDRDHRTAILPPGDYQITSVGQGTINWVTWPQKVQVQAGQGVAVKLDSGIRLVGPGAERNYDFHALDMSGRTIEEWQDKPVQLLPPGKYTIEARAGGQGWKRIAQGMEVPPGGLAQVNVPLQ
ncbi:MAG TPA: RHS repeat-associated core domain-containing protein [Candidatus Acidoferrales bacterium]|nr:RHS repeat-associated core domain-containing protein [Candidatus Acidoferrales bacterium]